MSRLQWEESLMADAAGANGGHRTLKEAIDGKLDRYRFRTGLGDRAQWCGECGAIEIDGVCTDRRQECSRSRSRL